MKQPAELGLPEIGPVLTSLAREGFTVSFAESEDGSSLSIDVIKRSDRTRRELPYDDVAGLGDGVLAREIQEAAASLGH